MLIINVLLLASAPHSHSQCSEQISFGTKANLYSHHKIFCCKFKQSKKEKRYIFNQRKILSFVTTAQNLDYGTRYT